MKLVIRAALCAAILAAATAAHAQTWPNRPIKVIVPTGPGAATDVMARLMAESVTRGLGQPVVVENLGGASGLIAHQTAARAPADGYTFLFSNTSGLAINPVSFKSIPYDPARDFTPVATIVDFGPQILSVNADMPVKTVAELIAYAKANPGKLSYAVDVTAGAAPIAARLFNKRGELGLVEVPYRSAAQMLQDVAAGTVPVLISSMAASNAMVQAGKVRRLAISSSKRFPPLPDLPAINETVPGVTMDGWFVLVAPTGTPAEAVQRMNREITARLTGFGLATSGAGTPQSTGEFIAREQEKWRALAVELKIEPQ
jgi:tripartite-type tricarboxylate transporter receptor subunit TctC